MGLQMEMFWDLWTSHEKGMSLYGGYRVFIPASLKDSFPTVSLF